MIDRFNFYDVYGYLLPGAALLGLLVLPFALVGRPLPSLEWSSALVSLVGAYFIGHVLQILARRGLPDYGAQHERFLDPATSVLPETCRAGLQRRIWQEFDLDITVAGQRQLAFDMCRASIQARGTPSYVEQYQGLYALLRGLAAACLLASANHLGWAMSLAVPKRYAWAVLAAAFAVEVVLLFTVIVANGIDENRERNREILYARAVLAFAALLLTAAGLATALQYRIPREALHRILAAVIPLLVLAFLFHRAFGAFAFVFAKTVVLAYLNPPRR